jgi:hypothetical protein
LRKKILSIFESVFTFLKGHGMFEVRIPPDIGSAQIVQVEQQEGGNSDNSERLIGTTVGLLFHSLNCQGLNIEQLREIADLVDEAVGQLAEVAARILLHIPSDSGGNNPVMLAEVVGLCFGINDKDEALEIFYSQVSNRLIRLKTERRDEQKRAGEVVRRITQNPIWPLLDPKGNPQPQPQ